MLRTIALLPVAFLLLGSVAADAGANYTFGKSLGKGGAAEGQLSFPQAVAVGPEGAVYVVDRGNQRVQKLNPADGKAELVFGKLDHDRQNHFDLHAIGGEGRRLLPPSLRRGGGRGARHLRHRLGQRPGREDRPARQAARAMGRPWRGSRPAAPSQGDRHR